MTTPFSDFIYFAFFSFFLFLFFILKLLVFVSIRFWFDLKKKKKACNKTFTVML